MQSDKAPYPTQAHSAGAEPGLTGDSVQSAGTSRKARTAPVEDPGEDVQILRFPLLPGVHLHGYHSTRRLWTVFHTSYDFCCATRASAPLVWECRGRRKALGEGSVGLPEPGEIHRTLIVPAATDLTVLLIDPAVMMSMIEDLHGVRPVHFRDVQIEDRSAYGGLVAMGRAVASGPSSEMELESRLCHLLGSLLVQHTEGHWKSPPVCQRAALVARDYVRDNSVRNVTLEECSRAAAISKFHLHRCFVSAFGITPHQYLTHVRVSRARDLLRAGIPPGEVATLVGFSDQPHMTRAFRRHVGVTPGLYARGTRRRPVTG